jgi:hypothetical protein
MIAVGESSRHSGLHQGSENRRSTDTPTPHDRSARRVTMRKRRRRWSATKGGLRRTRCAEAPTSVSDRAQCQTAVWSSETRSHSAQAGWPRSHWRTDRLGSNHSERQCSTGAKRCTVNAESSRGGSSERVAMDRHSMETAL